MYFFLFVWITFDEFHKISGFIVTCLTLCVNSVWTVILFAGQRHGKSLSNHCHQDQRKERRHYRRRGTVFHPNSTFRIVFALSLVNSNYKKKLWQEAFRMLWVSNKAVSGFSYDCVYCFWTFPTSCSVLFISLPFIYLFIYFWI